MLCSITLVHGTWAKGAAWVCPGSTIREIIQRELTGQGIDVRFSDPPFEWSGRNTHAARRDAAAELQAYLRAQRRDHPADAHFLIGHSHGGNVVLRCLRHAPDVARNVTGVVTLATPFLQFRPREPFFAFFPAAMRLASLGMLGLVNGGCLAAIFLLALISLPVILLAGDLERAGNQMAFDLCSRMSGWDCFAVARTATVAVLSVVAVAVVSFFTFGGYLATRDEHRKSAGPRFRAILQEFGYFQPRRCFHNIPTLSCSSSIDEALGVLHGSWWMHKLSSAGAQLASWAALVGIVGATLFALIGAATLSFSILFDYDFAAAAAVVAGAVTFAVALYASSAVASWLLRAGSVAPNLGFGWAETNLFVVVRAAREIRLSSLHENRRFSARSLWSASHLSLFHSRLYASPMSLEAVAHWIGRVCRGEVGKPSSDAAAKAQDSTRPATDTARPSAHCNCPQVSPEPFVGD